MGASPRCESGAPPSSRRLAGTAARAGALSEFPLAGALPIPAEADPVSDLLRSGPARGLSRRAGVSRDARAPGRSRLAGEEGGPRAAIPGKDGFGGRGRQEAGTGTGGVGEGSGWPDGRGSREGGELSGSAMRDASRPGGRSPAHPGRCEVGVRGGSRNDGSAQTRDPGSGWRRGSLVGGWRVVPRKLPAA